MAALRIVRLNGWAAMFLALAFLLALAAIVALFVSGLVFVSRHVIWLAQGASVLALVCCIFVFFPMSFFARTRRAAFIGFLGSAFLFGLATWILGLLSTYLVWGGLGVVIGLALGVVGIVPLGVLAALFGAQWLVLGQLVFGIALTLAARRMANGLSPIVAREDSDRRGRIIDGEIISRR